jgi:hypothetical protein
MRAAHGYARRFWRKMKVSRTDDGFVYHAKIIVRTLRLSGCQSQEVVCEAIPRFLRYFCG